MTKKNHGQASFKWGETITWNKWISAMPGVNYSGWGGVSPRLSPQLQRMLVAHGSQLRQSLRIILSQKSFQPQYYTPFPYKSCYPTVGCCWGVEGGNKDSEPLPQLRHLWRANLRCILEFRGLCYTSCVQSCFTLFTGVDPESNL